MSGSPSVQQLLERLARVEAVLAERDAQVEVLTARVAELEARLRKDSSTSSKPPSSDGPAAAAKRDTARQRSRRQPTGRDPGKQPGEPGHTLRQVADPDRVVVHRPRSCRGCGHSLRRAPVTSTETRQVFDLPDVSELEVTEHQLQHRRCRCGTTTMAAAPHATGAPTQYGPRVRAVGAYLVGYQHLPIARACEALADLLGVHLSAGTLSAVQARTAAGLEPVLAQIADRIADAPLAHFDETGLRVGGTSGYVHVAATELYALFHADPGRGRAAMAAAGILPRFTGIAVHDGYTPYRAYGTAHQLCNAHHLRELAAVVDTDPTQTWAEDLQRLLAEINTTCRDARDAGADAIAPRLLTAYQRRYDTIITAGQTMNPPPDGDGPHTVTRTRRSPATNLLARLKGFAGDVLRFAHNLTVPFDNNLAERDIRMVKLRQKISGGPRTWTGARTFCAIRSYLATTRKHGINTLHALTQLHNGQPWMPETS